MLYQKNWNELSRVNSYTSMNAKEITHEVSRTFPCFGGGKGSEWNPIAEALKDKRPQFAAGVDVESVVRFVLERCGIGSN